MVVVMVTIGMTGIVMIINNGDKDSNDTINDNGNSDENTRKHSIYYML